jgi:hypothetical protein
MIPSAPVVRLDSARALDGTVWLLEVRCPYCASMHTHGGGTDRTQVADEAREVWGVWAGVDRGLARTRKARSRVDPPARQRTRPHRLSHHPHRPRGGG